MRSALRPRPCRYVTLCSLVGRCARSGGSWQLVCSTPRRARCEWPRSTMCDAAATRTANPPNGSPLRSACSLDGRSCFHGRAAAGARLGNVEDTMRCSSQRPSCTSSPRTPRATRSSLRSTRTSNPRARPPSNNEHAPLRKEYCRRESTKCHRQALQQRQGAGLNTSKRKRQGARTARQATAVPPPVAPARGARSPRRAARTPCQRSRRMKKYVQKNR